MLQDNPIVQALSIPSGYAKFFLKLKLHPTQTKVLDTLFDKPKNKVCFQCGNEVGKSAVIAVVSILYAIHIRNCMVVSTSATFRQITKQLIPYLKQYSSLYPTWQFTDNSIKINGETRYIGFSTDSEAFFQGYHETPERPLLIIVDEAAGVSDNIFQAVARCNPTYLAILGSPLGPEGFFYSACTEVNTMKAFKHFKLTKYECTKDKGWWLDKSDIDNLIQIWGQAHPLILSSVYAEFSTNIEGGIITLTEIDKCLRNPSLPVGNDKHVAIDVAAGRDSNVIAMRIGNQVSIIKTWKDADTMNAAYTIVNELNKLKASHNLTAGDVSLDADGLGLPVLHRLKELGWPVNDFHGNSTSSDNITKNRITDCWINGCKKIRNGSITIPDNQELKLQLTSRKSFMAQSGKLQLESKEDMRARGIPSPDIADAILMAIDSPRNNILTSIKVAKAPPAQQYRIF